MGISCKPISELKSRLQKLQNEQLKEQRENKKFSKKKVSPAK